MVTVAKQITFNHALTHGTQHEASMQRYNALLAKSAHPELPFFLRHGIALCTSTQSPPWSWLTVILPWQRNNTDLTASRVEGDGSLTLTGLSAD